MTTEIGFSSATTVRCSCPQAKLAYSTRQQAREAADDHAFRYDKCPGIRIYSCESMGERVWHVGHSAAAKAVCGTSSVYLVDQDKPKVSDTCANVPYLSQMLATNAATLHTMSFPGCPGVTAQPCNAVDADGKPHCPEGTWHIRHAGWRERDICVVAAEASREPQPQRGPKGGQRGGRPYTHRKARAARRRALNT